MTWHRRRPVAVLTECTAHPWGRWHPKPLNQPGSQHIQVHSNARFHFFCGTRFLSKDNGKFQRRESFWTSQSFFCEGRQHPRVVPTGHWWCVAQPNDSPDHPTKNPKCGKTCKNMIKNRQVCSIQSKLLEFTSHSMSFMTLGVLTTSLHCNQDTQTWLSSLSFLALQSSMQLQNVETNNNPTKETPRYVWGPVLSLCLTKGPKLGKLKVGNSKIFQILSFSCQILRCPPLPQIDHLFH